MGPEMRQQIKTTESRGTGRRAGLGFSYRVSRGSLVRDEALTVPLPGSERRPLAEGVSWGISPRPCTDHNTQITPPCLETTSLFLLIVIRPSPKPSSNIQVSI